MTDYLNNSRIYPDDPKRVPIPFEPEEDEIIPAFFPPKQVPGIQEEDE